jgi:signal transduction histidine kinase
VAWPDGATVIEMREDTISVGTSAPPAYLPVVPALVAQFADRFTPVEAAALQGDRRLAHAMLQALTRSSNAETRAGALLRIGHFYARDGHPARALAAYDLLAGIDEVRFDEVPAALAARYLRCRLLESLGREGDLRVEGRVMLADLERVRWALTGPVYWTYVGDARRWAGSPADRPTPQENLAAAVAHVWARRSSLGAGSAHEVASGRDVVVADGSGERFVALWHRTRTHLRLLMLSEAFVAREWMPPAEAIAHAHDVRVRLRAVPAGPSRSPSGGSSAPTRPGVSEVVQDARATGLPWDLVVSGGGAALERAYRDRRRLLLAGFVTLAALAILATYVTSRAVGRELAAARLQSDFVAAVSHEFRTPLTTLRQFTDRLREHSSLPDEARLQCYDAQARATDRLTRLVESLLEFGRLEGDPGALRFEACDVGAVVRDVVAEFAPYAAAAGAHVQVTESEGGAVRADRAALFRAVWNLLDNAVKYSPSGADVHIDVRREGDDAVVVVRDSGIGIPADERAAIFRKFHRGRDARALGIRGTGLGLAMVERIARAHGGQVKVTSEQGRGSTFALRIAAGRG